MAVKELAVHWQKGAFVLYRLHNMGFQPTLAVELQHILERGLMAEEGEQPSALPLFAFKRGIPNVPGQTTSQFDK